MIAKKEEKTGLIVITHDDAAVTGILVLFTRATLSRVLAMVLCLSVCLSVCVCVSEVGVVLSKGMNEFICFWHEGFFRPVLHRVVRKLRCLQK